MTKSDTSVRIAPRKGCIFTILWSKLLRLVKLLAIINMYGGLDGNAADIGGNRGAVVQLLTSFKGEIIELSKVKCGALKFDFGVTENTCRGNRTGL